MDCSEKVGSLRYLIDNQIVDSLLGLYVNTVIRNSEQTHLRKIFHGNRTVVVIVQTCRTLIIFRRKAKENREHSPTKHSDKL